LSLTAPERETVITFNDAEDTATIHTHQRRIITKLKNNPPRRRSKTFPLTGRPAQSLSYPSGQSASCPRNERAVPGTQ
jgi:hypothetical protein